MLAEPLSSFPEIIRLTYLRQRRSYQRRLQNHVGQAERTNVLHLKGVGREIQGLKLFTEVGLNVRQLDVFGEAFEVEL